VVLLALALQLLQARQQLAVHQLWGCVRWAAGVAGVAECVCVCV
jgi:hypothetical protein